MIQTLAKAAKSINLPMMQNWLLELEIAMGHSNCKIIINNLLKKLIDKLISWADKWQTEFNVEKRKVLHVGRSNRQFSYS